MMKKKYLMKGFAALALVVGFAKKKRMLSCNSVLRFLTDRHGACLLR